MGTMRRWIARCLLFAASCFAGLAQAAPENGWWWNSSESGRGFFIEIAGTQVYMAGYFYESDGRATWLVSQGQTTTPTSYQGRLLAFGGGQTLFGDYLPPGPASDAGAVNVDFTDDQHAVLTWPGGSIAIERQRFGIGANTFQPYVGWWWNDTESGRGYSVEVQGDQLFLVGFMYDASGKPLWYFTAGKMESPTHFEGQLLQFGGGQTLTGTYRPPGTPVVVGTATLDFTAPDEATLTLNGIEEAHSPSSPVAKASKPPPIKRAITPQLPRVVPAVLPLSWRGTFTQILEFKIVAPPTFTEHTATITGTVTWVKHPTRTRPGYTTYALSGAVDLDFIYKKTAPLQDCDGTFKKNYPLVRDVDGLLEISNSTSEYFLLLKRMFSFTPVGQCFYYLPGRTVSTPLDATFAEMEMFRTGKIVYLRMQGVPPVITPTPFTTITESWDFLAN